MVLRKSCDMNRGARRVKAPASVTTRGTRALCVGHGGSPRRVGPRRGYLRGKHAEWTSHSPPGRAARLNRSIQRGGLADAGDGIPTSPTSSCQQAKSPIRKPGEVAPDVRLGGGKRGSRRTPQYYWRTDAGTLLPPSDCDKSISREISVGG